MSGNTMRIAGCSSLVAVLAVLGFGWPVGAQPTLPPNILPRSQANPEHERLKQDAEIAYQNSDFARCIDLTGRVLAQNPRDHVALYLRASARVELGALQRNVKEVRAGIEDAREAMRHGGLDQINYYLPYFYGMTALSQLEGRKDHAQVVVTYAAKLLARADLSPEEKANLLYQRATAYVALQELEAAAKDFRAAAVEMPSHLGARLGLADVYVQMQQPAKAEAAFTAAVESAPDNPLVYNNRGMFFQQEGKLREARNDFSKALELNPNFAVAYTNRGFVAMSEGDPFAAEADFTSSLKIDPNQPMVYSLRGTARLAQGNPQGCLADYNHVLRFDPRNPVAQADAGFAKYLAGDYAGAAAAFAQAVATDANLRYLNPWRYWALVKAGQADAANAQLSRMLSQPPQDKDWIDTVLRFLAGQLDEQRLLAAIEQQDGPLRDAQLCEAHFFLAEKKSREGDSPAATRHYQQALDTKQVHLSAYRGAMYALKAFPKSPKT
uniref:Tetratricopeptide repeat protein n=1 Tax=Schlesneria paludicola TaxID=360056 RepID=A0A7C4LLL1_9PLAN